MFPSSCCFNGVCLTGAQVADVYGYPVVSALKLLRVLCATGRNRAASLVSYYSSFRIFGQFKKKKLKYLSHGET